MDTELKAVGVGCIWAPLAPDGERAPLSLPGIGHSLECHAYTLIVDHQDLHTAALELPGTPRSRLIHVLHWTDAEAEAMEVHDTVTARRLAVQAHPT